MKCRTFNRIIFQMNHIERNMCDFIKNFVPVVQINNSSVWVQVMALRQIGESEYTNQWWLSSLKLEYVTWPQLAIDFMFGRELASTTMQLYITTLQKRSSLKIFN